MKEILISSVKELTWEKTKNAIFCLKEQYPFIEIDTIGKSHMGKDIFAIKLGCGKKKILINAAHHANEWITSVLLLKFIENYCHEFKNDGCIYGENIKKLWRDKTLCFVPME